MADHFRWIDPFEEIEEVRWEARRYVDDMEKRCKEREASAAARAEGAMNALAAFAKNIVLPWPEIKVAPK